MIPLNDPLISSASSSILMTRMEHVHIRGEAKKHKDGARSLISYLGSVHNSRPMWRNEVYSRYDSSEGNMGVPTGIRFSP